MCRNSILYRFVYVLVIAAATVAVSLLAGLIFDTITEAYWTEAYMNVCRAMPYPFGNVAYNFVYIVEIAVMVASAFLMTVLFNITTLGRRISSGTLRQYMRKTRRAWMLTLLVAVVMISLPFWLNYYIGYPIPAGAFFAGMFFVATFGWEYVLGVGKGKPEKPRSGLEGEPDCAGNMR